MYCYLLHNKITKNCKKKKKKKIKYNDKLYIHCHSFTDKVKNDLPIFVFDLPYASKICCSF
jgi:hypothetical protein